MKLVEIQKQASYGGSNNSIWVRPDHVSAVEFADGKAYLHLVGGKMLQVRNFEHTAGGFILKLEPDRPEQLEGSK